MRLRYALAVCAVSLIPCISLAQGTDVALGALVDSSTLPVQVTADQLEVRQSDGTAVFAGNVLVAQGEMRLTADRVAVEYETENGTPTGQIARMLATGHVLLVNRDEAAEGQNATYDIKGSTLVLSGGVLLTQGQNTLAGQQLTIDLKTGSGRIEGRVKTILQTGGAPE